MKTVEIVAQAMGKLDAAKGEVVLDFSAVSRIDASELRALENLAHAAEAKSVKLSVCGVNVDIYKVLKLVRIEGGL